MLKGGVIGFGRMGMTHYSTLSTHPQVEMVAVCDTSKFMLKFLNRYTELELFNDYKKLLKNVEMDFLVVATPTASHAPISLAAAEKGIHVFLEKPFTLTVDEGRQLIDVMKEKSLVGQVGYFLRFNCVFREVKQLLDRGLIGEVIHYKNEMYGRTVLKPSKSSWRAKKSMGGGCMMDFASHSIDLSDYLFGDIENVSGSLLKSIYSENVEDAVFANLHHAGGATGNLMINWSDETYRRPYNRVEILGTKGKIIADLQEYRLYIREDRDGYDEGWNIRYLPELEKGARFQIRGPDFTEQFDHFIECIEQGTESCSSFESGLRVDTVMEQIREDFERKEG